MDETLNKKTKILYGVAGIGDSALYNFTETFALFFFTTVAGINPAIAGTIVAVGAIWDVVSSSVVGYISDRTRSRFGRRKPFMLVVAFPLAVICSLMFTVFDVSQTVRIIYYIIMTILFWTGYSLFYIPYTTWGSELTDNYQERTSLRGIVYLFYVAGAAMATVVPTILVDFLMQLGSSIEMGWFSAAALIGVVSGAAIFVGAWFIKEGADDNRASEKELSEKGEEKKSVFSVIAEILKNYYDVMKFGPARYIILASMFYLVSSAVVSSDRMYYFTYVMDFSAKEISFVMFYQTAISACFVPVLVKVNRYLDKRIICVIGFAVASLAAITYGFTGIPNMAHLLIASTLFGAGSTCYWQLIPSMLYDTCDADKVKNHIDRAGLIISFQSLAEAVSEAIGYQALGLILSFAGYAGEASKQSAEALYATHVSFTFIPAVFMILAMLMIIKYPITREKHAEIQKRLKEQG